MTKTALIVIDIQNDYFADGAFALPAMEAAAKNAAALIAKFRGAGASVIHIQHIMTRPNPPFFIPGSVGEKIADSALPKAGEPVVKKNYANSFRDTVLTSTLQDLDVSKLVIVGAMTNNCVAATTRAATDFGYQVTVVHDACAAAKLTFQDTVVPSDMVHATFMAALGMQGAQVVAATEVVLDKPVN
ncbi:MAG: cysteine hydrolase [Proteobacteria bacterium]|nr:cysteine hydrolase [Pseudomonadota bacterium]